MSGCAEGGSGKATRAASSTHPSSESLSFQGPLPAEESSDALEAVAAFRKGCRAAPRPALGYTVSRGDDAREVAILDSDWKALCGKAAAIGMPGAARDFFEQNFLGARKAAETGEPVLFTGYYLPLIKASRRQDAVYRYPLYAAPPELKRATPEHPFLSRAEIEAGALDGRGLELLWTDDPVMRFFLHVQGSGNAILPDGRRVQLRYAGKNQQPYVAIGKQLATEGEIARDKLSLQTIRDWLRAHPARRDEVMNRNPSYVFFTLEETPKPIVGADRVELVAGRSLAVDPREYPYGIPVFVRTERMTEDGRVWPWRRVMFPEDTGSAIVGPRRADLYFGEGPEAEAMAGPMKGKGTITLLIPRRAYDRAAPAGRPR